MPALPPQLLFTALDVVARGRLLTTGDLAALHALGLALLGQPLDSESWWLRGWGWKRVEKGAPLRALIWALFRAHQPQTMRIGESWVRDDSTGKVAKDIVPARGCSAEMLAWYLRKEFFAALRDEVDADERDSASEREVPFSQLGIGADDRDDRDPTDLLAFLLGEVRAPSENARRRARDSADSRADLAASPWFPDALTPGRTRLDADAEARADERDAQALRSVVDLLDARGREILRLWVSMEAPAEIAEALGLSTRTVQRHLELTRRHADANGLDLDALRLRLVRREPSPLDCDADGLRPLCRVMTQEELAERERGYRRSGAAIPGALAADLDPRLTREEHLYAEALLARVSEVPLMYQIADAA